MFLDIETSYSFVANRINELTNRFGFNNSLKIMIYDFYPIIHELVSVVPASYMQPQCSLVEFRQSQRAYLTSADAQVPALNVMPFEKYTSELAMYKTTLQQMYPQYSVESKPDKVMYENYKNTIITRFISGIIGLDVGGLIDERPLFKYVPPEGSHTPLNREMYYVAIKRILPDLAISEMALDGLYNIYLEHFGLNPRVNQIPPMDSNVINVSLSFPDEYSMTNFITSISPLNITPHEIETLVGAYPNVDMVLQNKIMPYLNTMAGYGIRESIAIRMLLYHNIIFQSVKDGLLQRAGFVMNPAYSALFVVGEYQLQVDNGIQQDNLNIDYRAMQGIL